MKFSKSLLAVSMSAMMLFSSPVANTGLLAIQTVEAAVTKAPTLNKTSAAIYEGAAIQLSLRNAVAVESPGEYLLHLFCRSLRKVM